MRVKIKIKTGKGTEEKESKERINRKKGKEKGIMERRLENKKEEK